MDQHKGIVEKVFEIHDNLQLAENLFPEIENINDYSHAYSVYINNGGIAPLFGYISTTMEQKEVFGFKEYLAEYETNNFMDLLFLVDAYHCSIRRFQRLIDHNQHNFNENDVVDSILKDSKGILLWHHQLENLFSLFYVDRDQAVKLRKDVNKKVADVFDLADTLRFAEGHSLKDIIDERMIYQNTCYPNFKGSLTLFKYLS
jgi:hypothetical protein